jgi:hypothetical protein
MQERPENRSPVSQRHSRCDTDGINLAGRHFYLIILGEEAIFKREIDWENVKETGNSRSRITLDVAR